MAGEPGKAPRMAIAGLALSAAGLAAWLANEGYVASPHVPTAGDVPTIGFGSTRYEDGTRVALGDPPISRQRAEQLARALHSEEEARFRASLPGVRLTQGEYDLYVDFVGQFGIGNWQRSSMRRHLLAGNHRLACDALLLYRRQAGRDCSVPGNWGPQGCKGVWTRQLQRHSRCLSEQGG